MRKFGMWALLFVGSFLLVAALVARVWGYPAAQKTPLDTDSDTRLSGEASGAVVQVGDGEPQPVKAQNITKADSEASDGDVVVFAAGTCLVVDEDLDADQYCLEDDDLRIVSISAEAFATDRTSAVAVENGDYVSDENDQKEGLVNKWPFDVQQEDYEVWDDVLGDVVTAEYVGTEDIDGLETYKFEYSVDGVSTEIASGTQGTYTQNKVYWIDPGTGSIIKQTQDELRELPNGEAALDLELAYTDETVQNNVDAAKDNNATLKLISTWIPLFGGIIGVLALLGGAFLAVTGNRGGRRVQEKDGYTE